MNLEAVERAKYEHVWDIPSYRTRHHGLDMWRNHRELFPRQIESALDIGCGSGRLFKQWRAEGIEGFGVDFADNALDTDSNREHFFNACLWNMELGRQFDLGVCTDVMEHIPMINVDDVLQRIAMHCDTTIFKIANYPSVFGDLHLTCKPADWWFERLSQFGRARQIPFKTAHVEYVFQLDVHEINH